MAFITASTFAQDTAFKFSKDGLTDFIVTNYEGSAKDTYARAQAWVKDNTKKEVFHVIRNIKF